MIKFITEFGESDGFTTFLYAHNLSYIELYFCITVQSEPILSITSVVLKTFLKKIIKIKPIENSTLARVIINKDKVYI